MGFLPVRISRLENHRGALVQGQQNAVTNLKVRASYGSLGNSNVGNYAYDETFSFSNGRIINGSKVRYTSAPSPIPESLTWETAQTLDVGLDMSFLSGRLSFNGDWYSRKTLDMYTVGPTLPDVFGASSPKGNFAEMTTNGYEFIIKWNDSFNLAGKPDSTTQSGHRLQTMFLPLTSSTMPPSRFRLLHSTPIIMKACA